MRRLALCLAMGWGSAACVDPNVCNHPLDSVSYAVSDNTCGPAATGTLRVFSRENACEVHVEVDEGLGLPASAGPRMPGGYSSGDYLDGELWSLQHDRFDPGDAGPLPYLIRTCTPVRQVEPGPRTLLCRDSMEDGSRPECTAVFARQ
ncbi:hypothetical protein HPP05_37450 [Corallococcus exiguus]|uniref:hypothetical protein n=1 Tax=Corallococcus exiguus TaxID=83462 RepID=UPI0014941B5E|nr:hypothetical protein [Corallococcus exiguus]NPC75444.1 hypothetical protein [Corallococcus exiguus]